MHDLRITAVTVSDNDECPSIAPTDHHYSVLAMLESVLSHELDYRGDIAGHAASDDCAMSDQERLTAIMDADTLGTVLERVRWALTYRADHVADRVARWAALADRRTVVIGEAIGALKSLDRSNYSIFDMESGYYDSDIGIMTQGNYETYREWTRDSFADNPTGESCVVCGRSLDDCAQNVLLGGAIHTADDGLWADRWYAHDAGYHYHCHNDAECGKGIPVTIEAHSRDDWYATVDTGDYLYGITSPIAADDTYGQALQEALNNVDRMERVDIIAIARSLATNDMDPDWIHDIADESHGGIIAVNVDNVGHMVHGYELLGVDVEGTPYVAFRSLSYHWAGEWTVAVLAVDSVHYVEASFAMDCDHAGPWRSSGLSNYDWTNADGSSLYDPAKTLASELAYDGSESIMRCAECCEPLRATMMP